MKISFNRNYNRGDLTFNLYKINKNIAKQKRKVSCFAVVPFAGTWIEINSYQYARVSYWSFPSRERGLKSFIKKPPFKKKLSFPSRERGLK